MRSLKSSSRSSKADQELARAAKREEKDLRKQLANVGGSILRYMTALERESMPEDLIYSKLQELEAERRALQARLSTAGQTLDAPALHPAAVEQARLSMEAIRERLSDPANLGKARREFRAVVASVELHPTPPRQDIDVTVWSHFGRLFGAEAFPPLRTVQEMLSEEGLNVGIAGPIASSIELMRAKRSSSER